MHILDANTACISLHSWPWALESVCSCFKSSVRHLLPVPSGTTYSHFLSFSFLFCEMEMVWRKILQNVGSRYSLISTAKVVAEGREAQRAECRMVLGAKALDTLNSDFPRCSPPKREPRDCCPWLSSQDDPKTAKYSSKLYFKPTPSFPLQAERSF